MWDAGILSSSLTHSATVPILQMPYDVCSSPSHLAVCLGNSSEHCFLSTSLGKALVQLPVWLLLGQVSLKVISQSLSL